MTKMLTSGLTAAIVTSFALSLAAPATQAAQTLPPAGFDLPATAQAQILKVRQGRGGDDGPGHDANDDKGGKGRGGDDGPGDDKGGKGRGRDDGTNHS